MESDSVERDRNATAVRIGDRHNTVQLSSALLKSRINARAAANAFKKIIAHNTVASGGVGITRIRTCREGIR
jgi:hypothetical protein